MKAPVLILLCGPSMAGKSTFSQHCMQRGRFNVVSADEINAERALPFGNEGLPVDFWAQTLEIMVGRARTLLTQGKSVIIDDTLCFRWLRDRWHAEAAALGASTTVLLFPLTMEEAFRRRTMLAESQARPVVSEATLKTHLEQFEWPGEDEPTINPSEYLKLLSL